MIVVSEGSSARFSRCDSCGSAEPVPPRSQRASEERPQQPRGPSSPGGCPDCGAQNAAGSRFCARCRHPFGATTAQSSQPGVAPVSDSTTAPQQSAARPQVHPGMCSGCGSNNVMLEYTSDRSNAEPLSCGDQAGGCIGVLMVTLIAAWFSFIAGAIIAVIGIIVFIAYGMQTKTRYKDKHYCCRDCGRTWVNTDYLGSDG